MLFDKETKYWQEEYRKGKLDDEIMLGETRALLDGTAEKEFFSCLKCFLLAIPTILCIVVFGHIQAGNPDTYNRIVSFLNDYNITPGINADPTYFFVFYVALLTIILNIIITKKLRKK